MLLGIHVLFLLRANTVQIYYKNLPECFYSFTSTVKSQDWYQSSRQKVVSI